MTERGTPGEGRGVALVVGVAMWVVYAALDQTFEFGSRMGGPPRAPPDPYLDFGYVAPREAMFWLAHAAIALPAAAAIGWALAPRFVRFSEEVRARFVTADGPSRRDLRAVLFAYAALLFLFARVGQEVALLGLPITDDEYAARFGAQVFAQGRLMVPVAEPLGAFSALYTFGRDGLVTSMDFPGVVLTGAVDELLGLGRAVYAIIAAITGAAVVAAAHRAWDLRAALFAALLWSVSPMVLSLSMTTHGHLTSRMFVALALYFAAGLSSPQRRTGASVRTWLGLGLAAGLGFCTRPAEVGLLLAPFGAWMVAAAIRLPASERSSALRGVGWAVLGVFGPLAAFAALNVALTGDPLTPTRMASNPGTVTKIESFGRWHRMGANLGFNVTMLGVWFLGPIGVVLTLIGILGRAAPRRSFTNALALGFGLHLLLALEHDNIGIHSVGPIHYSDAAPVLTLLAVRGAVGIERWLAGTNETLRARLVATFASTTAVAYAVFGYTHAVALHQSASRLGEPAAAAQAQGIHHAVIRAPRPAWRFDLMNDPSGSWVMDHPPPAPGLTDDILWVYPANPLGPLRQAFPDRAIYDMRFDESGRIDIGPAVERAPRESATP